MGWFIRTIARFAYLTGITNHFHLTKSVGNDLLRSGKAGPWSVLTARYGLAPTAVLEADSASAAEQYATLEPTGELAGGKQEIGG